MSDDADPKNPKQPAVDVNMMKALSHPIRQRILQALTVKGELSAAEIARTLDESLEKVIYHVKFLERHDAIEMEREEIIRSRVVKIYRGKMRSVVDEELWSYIPENVREELLDQVFRQIVRNVQTSPAKDGLKDTRTVAAWASLELDDDAFQELSRWGGEMMDRAMELEKTAKQRLADLDPKERDARTRLVELDVMLYPLDELPEL